MLRFWRRKKKDGSEFIEQEQDREPRLPVRDGESKVPAFFLTRAVGWFGIAILVLTVSLLWVKSSGAGGLMGGAALVAVICMYNGVRTLRIGRRNQFFSLRLTCTGIRAVGALENLPAYVNPASNTAFRGGRQVTFATDSGTTVIFTYEKNRRFLVGARYDFYFNKPPHGEKITVEMLERLRIDHSLVREELSGDDITGEVSMGDAQKSDAREDGRPEL